MIKKVNNINGDIIKKKSELNDNDTPAHILRVLIETNQALRLSDIAQECKMSRERIYQCLKGMIEKGIIIKEKIGNSKYYYPQYIFWNNDIVNGMYQQMLPFIGDINETIHTGQAKIPRKQVVLENLSILLKLFSFEIEDLKQIL